MCLLEFMAPLSFTCSNAFTEIFNGILQLISNFSNASPVQHIDKWALSLTLTRFFSLFLAWPMKLFLKFSASFSRLGSHGHDDYLSEVGGFHQKPTWCLGRPRQVAQPGHASNFFFQWYFYTLATMAGLHVLKNWFKRPWSHSTESHIRRKVTGAVVIGRLGQNNRKAQLFDGQRSSKNPILLYWPPVRYLLLPLVQNLGLVQKPGFMVILLKRPITRAS